MKDTAHGICLATFAEAASGQTFNITRGEGRSLREFAELLRGYFPEIQIEERTMEVFRPSRGALDISKATEMLGYKPQYSLEEGIQEYVDFLQKHFSTGPKIKLPTAQRVSTRVLAP